MGASTSATQYILLAVGATIAGIVTIRLVQRRFGVFVHRTALERVCRGRPHDVRMTVEFERYLNTESEHQQVKDGAMLASIFSAIASKGGGALGSLLLFAGFIFTRNDSLEYLTNFSLCLCKTGALDNLKREVEEERCRPFHAESKEAEAVLIELWSLLVPDEPLPSREVPHWNMIGVRSEGPATDFDQMGMLGLHTMAYFARTHPQQGRSILVASRHPKYGYSYSVVMAEMVAMAHELLQQGRLSGHFYSLPKDEYALHDFQDVCGYLMQEFHELWKSERPESDSQRSLVRSRLRQRIEESLAADYTLPLHREKNVKEE